MAGNIEERAAAPVEAIARFEARAPTEFPRLDGL
jgi:hypothetical protein